MAEEHPELLSATVRAIHRSLLDAFRVSHRSDDERSSRLPSSAWPINCREVARSPPRVAAPCRRDWSSPRAPARTLSELAAAYRAAVADLSDAIRRPVSARRDRSLRGALEYIHQHYGERLELPKVAKVAGFTPKYFSQLFHEREKMTFERYLAKLRLERAKQLLSRNRSHRDARGRAIGVCICAILLPRVPSRGRDHTGRLPARRAPALGKEEDLLRNECAVRPAIF